MNKRYCRLNLEKKRISLLSATNRKEEIVFKAIEAEVTAIEIMYKVMAIEQMIVVLRGIVEEMGRIEILGKIGIMEIICRIIGMVITIIEARIEIIMMDIDNKIVRRDKKYKRIHTKIIINKLIITNDILFCLFKLFSLVLRLK